MGGRTDHATDRVAHAPIRTCVGCRTPRPKATLLRTVVRDAAVVADREARAPGRGAYLCVDASCLQQALRRGGAPLARALRAGAGVAIDAEALKAAARGAARHDDPVVRE